MPKTRRYKVTVERDESGWWIATVHGIPGVHTQGRTLEQVRTRAQEAVEAAKPGATIGNVVIEPKGLQGLVRKVWVARERANKTGAVAQSQLRRAARALDAKGVGRRDAGELLGVSFQRVQQLVEEELVED